MHKFEKFVYRGMGHKANKYPLVTFTGDAYLRFNVATMRKYIKDYPYAVFYYNMDARLIGIKLIKNDSRDAYKITRNKKNKSGSMSIKLFLKHYKIQLKKHPYSLGWDKQENMLTIDLKENCDAPRN